MFLFKHGDFPYPFLLITRCSIRTSSCKSYQVPTRNTGRKHDLIREYPGSCQVQRILGPATFMFLPLRVGAIEIVKVTKGAANHIIQSTVVQTHTGFQSKVAAGSFLNQFGFFLLATSDRSQIEVLRVLFFFFKHLHFLRCCLPFRVGLNFSTHVEGT